MGRSAGGRDRVSRLRFWCRIARLFFVDIFLHPRSAPALYIDVDTRRVWLERE